MVCRQVGCRTDLWGPVLLAVRTPFLAFQKGKETLGKQHRTIPSGVWHSENVVGNDRRGKWKKEPTNVGQSDRTPETLGCSPTAVDIRGTGLGHPQEAPEEGGKGGVRADPWAARVRRQS